MSLKPALFLDRDGTLIVDTDFVRGPEAVVPLPGAAEAVARANAAGWYAVVITNQSGIARGILTEDDYQAVAREVERQFAARGARLDLQLHCPHFPAISGPCECRKPGLKLYRQAVAQLGIDPLQSWFIGDRLRDLVPARALGGRGLHVLTGTRTDDTPITEAGFEQVADLPAAVARALKAR
ncbi:MAG: histidinol-phosphate phosphatase family protein [Gemmatimonadetes bacterium]|nr:histidinol-phosphate phosphatase family protein [Gemmatimonadota bacterium]